MGSLGTTNIESTERYRQTDGPAREFGDQTTLPTTLSFRIFSFDLVQKIMTRLNIHYVFARFGSVG